MKLNEAQLALSNLSTLDYFDDFTKKALKEIQDIITQVIVSIDIPYDAEMRDVIMKIQKNGANNF